MGSLQKNFTNILWGEKMTENKNKNFVITKKIAKHGSQAIIVIPRVLESRLKPGTIVQITMDILDKFTEEER